MQGTYWLTVLPETSKLVPGIKSAVRPLERGGVKITPQFDTKGATRAGQQAGRDLQSGMDSSTRGGGLGKLLRVDGARSAGQQAGREINAGIQSANIGRDAGSQLGANVLHGAEGIGRRLGGMIATGLKTTAAVGGTVAATGIAAALTAGFKRLTAIDDARFKLQGLGNDAGKVQGIMDNALAAVKGTAFGLDEAATTAATAVAAGIQPGEQLTGYLKLTADTAAIAGTSLADMGSIFNKVQTSGKAFTGDLNMLADRGLPVFTWLQEATGKTGEDFQKMVEEGGISSQMFQDAIAKNIAGAAQNMGQSVRGSLSNLKASFSRFGAELSGPIFAGLKPLAIGLTGTFDSVTAAIKPIMADLTAKVGPWADGIAAKIKAWADNGGMQKIVDWFGRMRDTVAGLTSGGGSGALTSITDSAKQLGPALQNAGPALQGLGDSMKAFGQALVTIGPETLTSVMVPALNLLAGSLKFLADNASWAVPVVGGLVLAIGGLSMAAKTISPIVGAISGMTRMFNAPIVLAQTAAIRAQAAAMTELSASLGVNTVSTEANSVAQTTNAATSMRARIAALASSAASKVAAAAQWLWNAAMLANPIGLIIAAVVAAGVAIWAFFTKTETGRKLWDKIWTGIKTTVEVVWNWLKTTLANAWTQIGPSVMKIGEVAKEAFGKFVEGAKTVWNAIQPAVEWIGKLWLAVQKMNFTVAVAALKALGATIGWLWTNVVVPAFSGIAATVSAWWDTSKMIWDAAVAAVGWVGDKIMWLWHNVAEPAFSAIGSAVSTFWDGIKGIWDLFMGAVDLVGGGITTLKDAFTTGFNAIKGVVETVWNFISGIFDKIKNGVGDIVDKLRGIPFLGSLIPGNKDGRPAGFAGGGVVQGPGNGTSDSVLSWLSNGEGVVKESAMAAGGSHVVAALNAGWVPSPDFLHGMIPGYAEGLNAGADYLRNTIMQQWPQITSIGGRRSEDGFGEHSSGNAIDVMIPNYSTPEGKALGDTIASFIAKNRDALGANGMIWRKASFGYGGSWDSGKDMPDRGSDTQNHMDHVHIILGAGRGAGAPSVDKPTASLSLPSGGVAGSSALGSSTSAGGGAAVDAAQTALKNAGQAVDDRTYARDRAQQKLDDLKAAGKDTTDAQHRLDVANRELADAQERQTKAKDKLSQAMTDAGKPSADGKDAANADGGFGDLGKSLFGGILESIGLDGSVFSNPLEWPTVKSAIAGVNVLGNMLSGGKSGSSGGSGGGDVGGILGGLASATGIDLNPNGSDLAAPAIAGGAAPDGGTDQGTGGNDNRIIIENAGMSPTDVVDKVNGIQNRRTRTTTVAA